MHSDERLAKTILAKMKEGCRPGSRYWTGSREYLRVSLGMTEEDLSLGLLTLIHENAIIPRGMDLFQEGSEGYEVVG